MQRRDHCDSYDAVVAISPSVQAIFNGVDVDGSGSLSLTDFLAASMNRRDLDERRLRLAFDRLDYDHSGFIDVTDLELTVGTAVEAHNLPAEIARWDTSGKGSVSFPEFLVRG